MAHGSGSLQKFFKLGIESHNCMAHGSGSLQKFFKLGTRQDCLSLFQCFDFFITRRLPDVKVLQDEITALMQFSIVVGKLFQLQHHCLFCLFCLNQVALCLSFEFGLVDNFLAFRFDASICLLHEIFVCLLCILFWTDGLCFHGFRIIDDFLDHFHDTTAGSVLLVSLKAWRRRGSCGLLSALLNQCCFLAVKVLQDIQRCLQKSLSLTLVCDCCLKFLVFLFAIFACSLHLNLHFGYL